MEANVLDYGRFHEEEGGNNNADGFGLVVQRRDAGIGPVGARSAGIEDPKRTDRRFGVKTGLVEGGLFSMLKKRLLKKDPAGAFIK